MKKLNLPIADSVCVITLMPVSTSISRSDHCWLAFVRDGMRTKESRVELVLPEYFEYEDFVEGCFDLGDRQIGVYFEHSLAYVSFAADRPECLTLLKETTEGSVFRHDGYGLADAGRFTGNE